MASMDRHRWEQIQATFDQLVELAPPAPGSRLATLGSSDPSLRAAVESMLAADAAADTQLAALDSALLSPSPPPPDLSGLARRSVARRCCGAKSSTRTKRTENSRMRPGATFRCNCSPGNGAANCA